MKLKTCLLMRPSIHRALKMRAAETGTTMSALVEHALMLLLGLNGSTDETT